MLVEPCWDVLQRRCTVAGTDTHRCTRPLCKRSSRRRTPMASTRTAVKPTTDGSRTATAERLSAEELRNIDAYWRACNYLAAGMIYLRANPLLREPLMPAHVKLRLLGHWGSSPGLSFAYIHLNCLITKYDLDAIFLAGPGHGAPGVLAPTYLEGTYSEVYPNK